MRFLLIQRQFGNSSQWTPNGPFATTGEAERAATAALGTPTCLGCRVLTLGEMRAIVSRPNSGDHGLYVACSDGLVTLREGVTADYPETRTMPDEIRADYLADRGDPRETVYR